MELTKNDLPMFKVGTKVAYRNVSGGIYGDIGIIEKAEMYSDDDEFEFNGICLTIAISDNRKIYRDAEEIILLE